MPNDIKEAINMFITGISKIVGDKLDKVILYGSYARNTQNQDGEISDIDIMILVNMSDDELQSIQNDILNYSADINFEYNVFLSPYIETTSNYNSRVTYMLFYKNVEKEGKVLYA